MPKTVATPAHARVRTRPAVVTAIKVAVFYLVVMKFAQSVFFFFWGNFSIEPLLDMIGKWHIDDYRGALGSIYSLSVMPLNFALLTILAPLVGWWVYSRVEPKKQGLVGWLAAALYVLADSAIMLATMPIDFGPVSWALSCLISLTFVMLLMGSGFLVAKLFRLRL